MIDWLITSEFDDWIVNVKVLICVIELIEVDEIRKAECHHRDGKAIEIACSRLLILPARAEVCRQNGQNSGRFACLRTKTDV